MRTGATSLYAFTAVTSPRDGGARTFFDPQKGFIVLCPNWEAPVQFYGKIKKTGFVRHLLVTGLRLEWPNELHHPHSTNNSQR